MSNSRKVGGIAAFVNAVVAVASLIVAFGFIGLEALTDNGKLMELAISNPSPLFIQDMLKFLSAIVAIVLIIVLFNLLKIHASKLAVIATVMGSLAVVCLVVNAGLSAFLVSKTASHTPMSAESINRLNGTIALLGMAVIFFNGIWYLLISRSALRQNLFPKPLNYLGMGMGLLSLLPPLGILVLLLSIIWSFWLGQVLTKEQST